MTQPQGADWLGYLAAMLVFCSFYARTIVVLRLVAITSNMAFIGYAFAKSLYPVLILHVVLLPLNCLRLAQLRPMTKRPERENSNLRTQPCGSAGRASRRRGAAGPSTSPTDNSSGRPGGRARLRRAVSSRVDLNTMEDSGNPARSRPYR